MARKFRRNRREEQREYVDFEGTGHADRVSGAREKEGEKTVREE